MKGRGALAVSATAAWALEGCGGDQSPLSPDSEAGRQIATLWWWMLVIATIVFLGAVLLLVMAWFRRGRRGLPLFGENERLSTGLVVVFGMAIPIVVNVAVFIFANLVVIHQTEAPAKASTAMTVTVIGHQWFWEVRYPGSTAVTANEIHIPVDTRVNLVARSDDVIHSFWVPELNRKIDMIPGQANRLLLDADDPGVYRGQCAEFCGLQHAHMVMKVFVDPPAEFRDWLRREALPAPRAASPDARVGEQVFMSNGCADCHTIRGTKADGDVGPDLTHVGARTTIAGAILENTPQNMRAWIADPQHFKPGAKMPGLKLTDAQVDELADYLLGLR
jgi:cytochrome c oxidase subunit 2